MSLVSIFLIYFFIPMFYVACLNYCTDGCTFVGFNDWKLSTGPLYSKDAEDCNYVVLFGANFALLSHFDLADETHPRDDLPAPESYLQAMIACAEQKGHGDLEAILVGGEILHFKRNAAFLASNGIPVIASYCDHGSEDTNWCNVSERSSMGTKDIVVMPAEKRAILYSKPAGYVCLQGHSCDVAHSDIS